MKKILVTGGAGYIGSNCVKFLQKSGYAPIVLDNLIYGHKESISPEVKFIEGDLSNKNLLNEIFKKQNIDAVIHFAAYTYVGESVKNPKKYFENNYVNGLNLLNTMVKNNVKKIVFSSSCAIFGEPNQIPISENMEKKPINPYGLTKKMFEDTLDYYDKAYNLKSICLRYFNAAGADFGIGEDHNPETHLIPLILQTLLGKRKNIKIFGTDYNTKDGTCIRDYIHISDLSKAHILALDYLFKKNKSEKYNLGSEKGFSVKEIINKCEEITNRTIPIIEDKRREGDPPMLISDSKKIKEQLKWKPIFNLDEIISSAWKWHKNNPNGYKK
jgi:UDP-glucose 4-epimerase